MYSYGLTQFAQAKRINLKKCLNLFFIAEGIKRRTPWADDRYIANNWTKFATFVDQKIKEGTLEGRRIKLNTYYDEQKEKRLAVKDEYFRINPSDKQLELLAIIKEEGVGVLHSELSKLNIKPVAKDRSASSLIGKWLSLINQVLLSRAEKAESPELLTKKDE